MTPLHARRLPPPVVAVFPDHASADDAFRLVTEHGYEPHEVAVVVTEDTRRQLAPQATLQTHRVAQGMGVGGAVGGAVGAVAAALVAAGAALTLPGLGVVVAGPLAGLFTGGAAGSLTGGLIGALIAWGVPEEEAAQWQDRLRRGAIVLRLQPHNAEDALIIGEQWRLLRARLLAG